MRARKLRRMLDANGLAEGERLYSDVLLQNFARALVRLREGGYGSRGITIGSILRQLGHSGRRGKPGEASPVLLEGARHVSPPSRVSPRAKGQGRPLAALVFIDAVPSRTNDPASVHSPWPQCLIVAPAGT